jgi:hypothetical protein
MGPTERGAFLDIALDFFFYAAIPFAFALAEPILRALYSAEFVQPRPGCASSPWAGSATDWGAGSGT